MQNWFCSLLSLPSHSYPVCCSFLSICWLLYGFKISFCMKRRIFNCCVSSSCGYRKGLVLEETERSVNTFLEQISWRWRPPFWLVIVAPVRERERERETHNPCLVFLLLTSHFLLTSFFIVKALFCYTFRAPNAVVSSPLPLHFSRNPLFTFSKTKIGGMV